jgi:hypothetical protein
MALPPALRDASTSGGGKSTEDGENNVTSESHLFRILSALERALEEAGTTGEHAANLGVFVDAAPAVSAFLRENEESEASAYKKENDVHALGVLLGVLSALRAAADTRALSQLYGPLARFAARKVERIAGRKYREVDADEDADAVMADVSVVGEKPAAGGGAALQTVLSELIARGTASISTLDGAQAMAQALSAIALRCGAGDTLAVAALDMIRRTPSLSPEYLQAVFSAGTFTSAESLVLLFLQHVIELCVLPGRVVARTAPDAASSVAHVAASGAVPSFVFPVTFAGEPRRRSLALMPWWTALGDLSAPCSAIDAACVLLLFSLSPNASDMQRQLLSLSQPGRSVAELSGTVLRNVLCSTDSEWISSIASTEVAQVEGTDRRAGTDRSQWALSFAAVGAIRSLVEALAHSCSKSTCGARAALDQLANLVQLDSADSHFVHDALVVDIAPLARALGRMPRGSVHPNDGLLRILSSLAPGNGELSARTAIFAALLESCTAPSCASALSVLSLFCRSRPFVDTPKAFGQAMQRTFTSCDATQLEHLSARLLVLYESVLSDSSTDAGGLQLRLRLVVGGAEAAIRSTPTLLRSLRHSEDIGSVGSTPDASSVLRLLVKAADLRQTLVVSGGVAGSDVFPLTTAIREASRYFCYLLCKSSRAPPTQRTGVEAELRTCREYIKLLSTGKTLVVASAAFSVLLDFVFSATSGSVLRLPPEQGDRSLDPALIVAPFDSPLPSPFPAADDCVCDICSRIFSVEPPEQPAVNIAHLDWLGDCGSSLLEQSSVLERHPGHNVPALRIVTHPPRRSGVATENREFTASQAVQWHRDQFVDLFVGISTACSSAGGVRELSRALLCRLAPSNVNEPASRWEHLRGEHAYLLLEQNPVVAEVIRHLLGDADTTLWPRYCSHILRSIAQRWSAQRHVQRSTVSAELVSLTASFLVGCARAGWLTSTSSDPFVPGSTKNPLANFVVALDFVKPGDAALVLRELADFVQAHADDDDSPDRAKRAQSIVDHQLSGALLNALPASAPWFPMFFDGQHQ